MIQTQAPQVGLLQGHLELLLVLAEHLLQRHADLGQHVVAGQVLVQDGDDDAAVGDVGPAHAAEVQRRVEARVDRLVHGFGALGLRTLRNDQC